MTWLVDGMNVIGARPDGWWRDREGAQRRFVAALEEWAKRTGEDVAVVFDGAPWMTESGAVEVAFARRRGRDAADDDIAARVRDIEEPGSVRVVTSDATLAERVRRAGATVEGAGAFRRRIA